MHNQPESRAAALGLALKQFGEAWARGDLAVLDGLLSPTYTHNDAFGARHDRASWLPYVGERGGRGTQIEFRGVETRIFGDTAIVTGVNDIKGGGARSPGDKRELTIVFMQVWVWHEGKWLREAFQATPVVTETAA